MDCINYFQGMDTANGKDKELLKILQDARACYRLVSSSSSHFYPNPNFNASLSLEDDKLEMELYIKTFIRIMMKVCNIHTNKLKGVS
jgi:hypothetical protein